MKKKAKITTFMAKMKVYEEYKCGKITEEQANYFIDMIEKAEIKSNVLNNLITNEYHDIVDVIFNDCKTKAEEQGFGYKSSKLIEEMNTAEYKQYERKNALLKLKAFAIYISKTTAINKGKAIMLEDITGETVPFPTEELRHAKGEAIIEEKFILQDYLKKRGMNEAYRELMDDINFTCRNK